jgi:heme A synthase
MALGALYVAQVAVGALNVAYEFPDSLTVTHTAIAGLVWFVLSSGAVLGLYSPAGARAPLGRAKVLA